MQTISLQPLYHRGGENIAIYFERDASLNLAVRQLPTVRWSQTNRCWYIPLSEQGCILE